MNNDNSTAEKKSIVIVDDIPNNLRVLSEILSNENYRVRPTTSGVMALETIKASLPDLILLDIKMPDMNGYEVCKRLKENEQTRDVPVVFISALDETTDITNAFAAGGVDYITKPFASAEILARVKTHINLRSAGLDLERNNKELKEAREALKKINENLEKKISARTRDLTASNQKLQNEVTEHKKTETLLKLDEERLEALLKLNKMDHLSEDEIVETILEEAVRLTRSKIGFFHYISDDKKHIKPFKWSREVLDECQTVNNEVYPLEEAGAWADCLHTGKPVVHNDYQLIQSQKGYPDGHPRIERHLSVPIFDNDQIIAIIGMGNKTEAYSGSDIRQLTLFSQSMWRMIQQIRSDEKTRELEKQLRQAQKLEALGTLAGGIAHDFNNILSPILGFAEITMDDLPQESQSHQNLKEIFNAGMRATDLVRQILAFSRQSEYDIKPVKIQLIIKEVIKLLRASLPSSIEIHMDLKETGHLVMADPTRIHQVIMNLCTNAFHAMRETGGTLDITLNETELGADDLTDNFADMAPGKCLKLSVKDTGKGMDRQMIEKIFDPYFTTKEKGEGTGLGLSVIHGIVKSINGKISVYSEPGNGSVFHVYLPVIRTCDTKGSESPVAPAPTGTENILMVDDDNQLRRMIQKMLEKLGYKVTAMSNSMDALKEFKKYTRAYDLVITDMTMPKMTGKQLSEKLLAIQPDLPVIICTGFSEYMNKKTARAMGICGFVMKPIIQSELAFAVRKALDGT